MVADFFIDTNNKGCTWGYFWLVGLHAKKKLSGGRSGRLVGKAALNRLYGRECY
jgi:hypothetical protein